MRIVIEVDDGKVTSIGAEDTGMAENGDVPPGAPPAELLARAKKLGALSAGPSTFGRGAAPADEVYTEPPRKPGRRAKKKSSLKRA